MKAEWNSKRDWNRKDGFFRRPRTASLGDTPKSQTKGKKSPAPGKYFWEGEGPLVTLVCSSGQEPRPAKTRFGGVKTAVIRLAEADTAHLLQLGKITRYFRCLGYGHGSRGYNNPDKKDACWRCGTTGHLARSCKAPPRCLMFFDRSDKDITHVSGLSLLPVFREELRRLRGRNWCSSSSTSERGKMPRTFRYRMPGRGGPMYCSLLSSTNGLKTLLGIRIHQEGPASLFVALIWAAGIFWSPTRGSFGGRWWVCVCTAATSPLVILSRSSRPRSSFLRRALVRPSGGPS